MRDLKKKYVKPQTADLHLKQCWFCGDYDRKYKHNYWKWFKNKKTTELTRAIDELLTGEIWKEDL